MKLLFSGEQGFTLVRGNSKTIVLERASGNPTCINGKWGSVGATVQWHLPASQTKAVSKHEIELSL